jgi:PmbA/TldA metallopeptidase C-terminal domain
MSIDLSLWIDGDHERLGVLAAQLSHRQGWWQVFAEKSFSELVVVNQDGVVRAATASRIGTSVDIEADGRDFVRSVAAPGVASSALAEPAQLVGMAWQQDGDQGSGEQATERNSGLTGAILSTAQGLWAPIGSMPLTVRARRVLRSVVIYGSDLATPSVSGVFTTVVTVETRPRDINDARRFLRRFALTGRDDDELRERIIEAVEDVRNSAEMSELPRPAPAGERTILFAGSSGGTLLHEACGHGLEADAFFSGGSVWQHCLGKRVSQSGITIVDEGDHPGLAASSIIDDEGMDTQRTVLVDAGVLTGVLTDRLHAVRYGARRTASGRRQSYLHPVLPRMRNLSVGLGEGSDDDLIAETSDGILVQTVDGGEVTMSTGKFAIGCLEAYAIDQGRIGAPLEYFTIIGDSLSLLSGIDAIGSHAHRHHSVCGKAGQRVEVTSASPLLRVDSMLVGGSG